jgi:hypothetical protein
MSKGFAKEQVVEGWFPLCQRKSIFTVETNTNPSQNCNLGYIKLRFQWVFSDTGLLQSSILAINKRVDALEHLRESISRLLSKIGTDEGMIKSNADLVYYRPHTRTIKRSVMSLVNAGSSLLTDLENGFASRRLNFSAASAGEGARRPSIVRGGRRLSHVFKEVDKSGVEEFDEVPSPEDYEYCDAEDRDSPPDGPSLFYHISFRGILNPK